MYKRTYFMLITIVLIVALFSACGSPTASSNPAASGSPAASNAPESSAAANTPAPEKATSAAFKYYTAVDIGMTKDEVEQKTGLAAEQDDSELVPEGQTGFYYLDAEGEGIYVLYDGDSKLTSKTVQYKDASVALPPYTSKPVTEAQCDQITDGMAHADVVKILGSEGVECSKTQSVVFGETTVGTIYRWGNPDGTFIQVPFTSDDTANLAMYFDHG